MQYGYIPQVFSTAFPFPSIFCPYAPFISPLGLTTSPLMRSASTSVRQGDGHDPLQSSATDSTDDSLIGTAADRVVAGMGETEFGLGFDSKPTRAP